MKNKKMEKKMTCSAVVPAAGSSTRMGCDKLFLELMGIPVLARTLMVLNNCDAIHEIVIPTRSDAVSAVEQLCRQYGIDKAAKIIPGGDTRAESVLCGLKEVDKHVDLVAIHDAARPFVTDSLIRAAIDTAARYSAAAPAVAAKDTIKRAKDGVVLDTPEREFLYAVQTPQVFDKDLILGALSHAVSAGVAVTDDCSAVEAVGMRVCLTEGDYFNIKITTPEDMVLAQAILDYQKGNGTSCE